MVRHLAIGDIHGCYEALCNLATFVEFRAADVVITLGDYVDRGPNSRAVLEWLIAFDHQQRLVPIRGNHDIMMLAARHSEESERTWLGYGGDTTLQSYVVGDNDSRSLANVPDEHWSFLNNRLVASYETEQHFFVHANAYPDIPLQEQPDYMLYWEKVDNPPRHDSGKVMICGHTSQRSGLPICNAHAICIDSRVYDTGWLTCLHVETGQIWQANESGETRRMHLDDCDTWS